MLEPLVPADTILSFYTGPPTAPKSINDNETSARSADICLPELISMLPRHAGFVVACYSEHSLVPLLRQYTKKPVVGIFEASITHALLLKGPGGWGIVTTGKIWEDLLSIGVGNFVGEDVGGFEGVESTGLNADELHSVGDDEVKKRIGDAVVRLCAGMAGLDDAVTKALEPLGKSLETRSRVVKFAKWAIGLNEARKSSLGIANPIITGIIVPF
ncbi:hypothetical protein TWF703_005032 [Orbilia oligospora]|uniref:Uncharacterized protein n=1 Tax=Orbilia oligospora TaxID=2813651 RepID=A0A7C8JPL0_ORBOL|nr:hypothetical protein TWF703_005032 [Orbilia oligospora]